ncbi:hypothetical protein [Enterococcus faecium]|uniref:hypothetical protein n=1 Tax=Enterococcus faecium TaxID=1352 RepID=UPI001C5BBD0C|nr:hypothetical protein [Enterococcus faecium]QXZ56506.1 hypothetical protein KYK17_13010 [Enterococcus faecium]
MEVNDIVIVSDEFKTTNGYLIGHTGRVTSIKKEKDNPITVTFFHTDNIEIFHESELTILKMGESNGGN